MGRGKRKRILEDSQKRGRILGVLAIGCSLRAAARIVNCSPSTICREARLDPDFAAALEKAKGDSEVNFMKRIFDASKKDQYWRAAAWALERRHPEHYAPRAPEAITIGQIARLVAKLSQIIEEEIPAARFRKKVLARLDALTREAVSGQPPAAARQSSAASD